MKNIQMMILIILLILPQLLITSDWPQYLGPDRNAVSTEKGLIRTWTDKGPEVLWTIPLGEGYGGPIVSGNKVYIYDRVDDKYNVLRCIDISNGKELWNFKSEVPGKIQYNGSRSVPTIDGNMIYICGPFGNVHCLDVKTHKVIWKKNIWTDFGGTKLPRWAIAQSPLIYKNTVILASQTSKAGIVAYDKKTGAVRWTTPKLPGHAGYVSPRIVKISGRDHLTMVTGNGEVMGFDPDNGKKLWSYAGWKCPIPVPNVTETGKNRLFVTSGYRAGSAMIRINKTGNKYKVEEIFRTKEFSTHIHPAVFYKDHLYGHCGTNETKDGMVCMDLKGNVKWKTKRKPDFDKGGFILVDGMIVAVDGTRGNLYLVDPNPVEFKYLAKAKLLDTKQCWAPLALSNGKLLIRDMKQMKCVKLK